MSVNPARIYVIATLVLVAALYLAYGAPRRDDPLLALEATFGWLAVFIAPLAILDGSLALARRVLRPAGGVRAIRRRG